MRPIGSYLSAVVIALVVFFSADHVAAQCTTVGSAGAWVMRNSTVQNGGLCTVQHSGTTWSARAWLPSQNQIGELAWTEARAARVLNCNLATVQVDVMADVVDINGGIRGSRTGTTGRNTTCAQQAIARPEAGIYVRRARCQLIRHRPC
jgi:hypothetical protein